MKQLCRNDSRKKNRDKMGISINKAYFTSVLTVTEPTYRLSEDLCKLVVRS